MRWKHRRAMALEYLRSIYRYNEESGAFIIDVNLPDYSHAFSQWDSAWVEVREVAPGLFQYLKECSDDIPFRSPLEIVFSIHDPRDYEAEEQIIRGIRNFFRYEMFVERARIRKLVRRGLHYVGVAVLFLVAAAGLEPVLGSDIVGATVREGLYVGGWVFMWEAISQAWFQRASIRRTIAAYERFFDASIRFESSGTRRS
ncbi:MAG: hypothetical protein ACOCXE_03695 [Spirochaetota bacterium]